MQVVKILKQKAQELKAEAQVLMIAYKDRRTPLKAKIIIGLTIGYFLCPVDLIPDFIPVLGLLDDLIIVPGLIAISIKLISVPVLLDARDKVKKNPQSHRKNNWYFAIIIMIIWLSFGYFLYQQFKHLWI